MVNYGLKDKVALITGANNPQGIGAATALAFAREGAKVALVYKKLPRPFDVSKTDRNGVDRYFAANAGDASIVEGKLKEMGAEYLILESDISNEQCVKEIYAAAMEKFGKVDILVNNALPLMKGIDDCSYEEFAYALAVGVSAPFYPTKLFAPHFAPGASIINISSSRDRMSQPQTESYTAAKGGIAALTHGLAASLAGKVRVNSISPGWIDTLSKKYDGPDAAQHFAGRVGTPADIAEMVLYLASDKAGFITGENICIDGGMTRNMIYHNDFGWRLEG